MDNFDLSDLALQSAFPTNHILYDDQGLPSVMVYIPKFTLDQVIDGASSTVHPAFIVDGEEVDGVYISKYQNVLRNSRAYSLPGRGPAVSLSYTNARTYCENKGAGWHLMSAMEWGALAYWCYANDTVPLGNNNYGKDKSETLYIAKPMATSSGSTTRVATGTGPVTWSHNHQLDGIYDLNGNVEEWIDGIRTVCGELQILENNNCANLDNDKSATSSLWMAIDGTTGELITPDGSGTTENSLKLDYDSTNRIFTWITGEISGYSSSSLSWSYFYKDTCDDTVCDDAKELLMALGLLPADSSLTYGSNTMNFLNAEEERVPTRGGRWSDGTGAGVFKMSGNYARSSTSSYIGFRSAFYE